MKQLFTFFISSVLLFAFLFCCCKQEMIIVQLERIFVQKAPDKTEYYLYEKIDLSGLSVFAEYNDKTTEDITNSNELIISGFDSTTSGKKTVTLTYKEKTASFDVTVKEAQLTSIKLKSEPAKTEYYTGELIDFTGMVVKAKYEDGAEIDATGMVEVTGVQNGKTIDIKRKLQKAETITITVKLENKSAQFDISVKYIYVFHDEITKENVSGENVYLFGDFPQKVYELGTEEGDLIFPYGYTDKDAVKKGSFTYCKGSDNNYYYFISNGSKYFYKVEPIKWRCINSSYNGGKLLICEKVLFANYPDFSNPLTNSTDYSESDIRKALNGYGKFESEGFNAIAFGGKKPEELMKTKISLPNGNFVEDEVFIPGFSDIIYAEYFNGDSVGNSKCNYIESTDYANNTVFSEELAENEIDYVGGWILRPEPDDEIYVVNLKMEGKTINNIYKVEEISSPLYGICPAIVVNSPTVE